MRQGCQNGRQVPLTCDLATCVANVTGVYPGVPPSEVPLVVSADGRWLLRQEREQDGRRLGTYTRYLELWRRLDDDRWVREPGAWHRVEDLPRLVRELFGLP
jgi:hypothetical protein